MKRFLINDTVQVKNTRLIKTGVINACSLDDPYCNEYRRRDIGLKLHPFQCQVISPQREMDIRHQYLKGLCTSYSGKAYQVLSRDPKTYKHRGCITLDLLAMGRYTDTVH